MADTVRERTRFLESHPLAIAITVIALFFLAGGFILLRREGRTPTPESVTWNAGVSTFQNPIATGPGSTTDTPASPTTIPSAPDTVQLPPATTPTNAPVTTDTGFQSFLTGLMTTPAAGSAAASSNSTASSDIFSAFSYLPQGLISTTLEKPRTPEQEILHTYGNAAGAFIKRFEAGHPDMVSTLEAFTKDRTSAEGATGMRAIAADLTDIGASMLKMDNIPEEVRSAHETLAHHYEDIGAKLAVIANSSTDEGYLDAITTYNAAADSFTGGYIALMTLFAISGVSFSAYEDGSAFSYPGGGGF